MINKDLETFLKLKYNDIHNPEIWHKFPGTVLNNFSRKFICEVAENYKNKEIKKFAITCKYVINDILDFDTLNNKMGASNQYKLPTHGEHLLFYLSQCLKNKIPVPYEILEEQLFYISDDLFYLTHEIIITELYKYHE